MSNATSKRRKTVVIKCKEGIIKFHNIPLNVTHKTILERARMELSKIHAKTHKGYFSIHYVNFMLNSEVECYEGRVYIETNEEVVYDKIIDWKVS